MRSHISASLATHKLVSRSPSPIVSNDQKIIKSSPQVQVPIYLQSSPFRSPNSFLNSPNKTNSAVKQLHLLHDSNHHDTVFLANNAASRAFMIPKEVNEKIIALEAENNQMRNEIALLNGMNQTKENYIKELEEKIGNLYSENRKEETNCYNLKKKEEHINILLKEQKRLFDNKEKILQKEIEDLRIMLSEKNSNNFDILDKTDNSKEITREVSKNMEIEKTYLESTLKIYKVNIAELETKIIVLNNENNKLNRMLNEKMTENLDFSRDMESKLKQEFEAQRKEVEGKLAKILEENKKIVTFNNSLLSELEHYKSINGSLQRKHESHIEELKNSWKMQADKKIDDLKNKSLSERKGLENQISLTKDFSSDLEKRYQDCLEENNKIRVSLLEKENKLSEYKERISYLQGKISQEEEMERTLLENIKKVTEVQERNNVLMLENKKIKEVIENNNKELELWREKYTSTNEIHAKVVEDFKFQLENRRSVLMESEVKQRTLGLENENSNLKTKMIIYETEKKSLEEKISLLNDESRKFEQIIYERMEEVTKLSEELKALKSKEEETEDKEALISEKDAKISHLEDQIGALLTENNKLNQTMKVSINEKELLLVKFEAFKQDNINKIEEMKLRHSKELVNEVKKEVEQYRQRMIESEARNQALINELDQLNMIQENMNQTLGNYSNVLIEKDQEIILLRDQLGNEKERNEQNRFEREKFEIEREQMVQKIQKIEENHQIQLKELRNNIKSVELTFEDKKKMELNFNKEVSIHKDSLKLAKERLLECHRVLLAMRSNKPHENQTHELNRNLEEAEKTIFMLKELLNEKDTLNPYQRNDNFASFMEDSRENATNNQQEITHKMIAIEKEHEKCYEDIRQELEIQLRNHAMNYCKLKEEFDFYRQNCVKDHLKVISTLENQLDMQNLEKEQVKSELLGQLDRVRAEMHAAIHNFELSANEMRFNCEKDCENRIKCETFQLRAENNELKRGFFELENENRRFRREIQMIDIENLHLKKNLSVLSQKNNINAENMRNILGSVENGRVLAGGKENEILKARINELENLNKSFDSLKMADRGRKPGFKKPISMLSENERLNNDILKRCRDILN